MAQNPIVGLIAQRVAAYNRSHPGRPIDPQAAFAVASQEGLGGGVGDNGTSFGPWQLHQGGALPTGIGLGGAQQWAQSPAGVDYALGRIGGVSGGLSGPAAVKAIVTQFERPANPGREIAGALSSYGSTGGGGSTSAPAPVSAALTAGAPQPDARRQFATALLSGMNNGQLNQDALMTALTQRRQTLAAPQPVTAPAAGAPSPPGADVGGRIAKTALTQLGTPYQWGGQAKLGSRTDCSGLLQASAAANGVKIGRTTYQQYEQGAAVPLDQLQPGDAVFSHPTKQGPGHVSIYIGNGKIVEDPHTGSVVSIATLAGRGGIVGARRYG